VKHEEVMNVKDKVSDDEFGGLNIEESNHA